MEHRVAVVDINNDGLNDIYVCRVGNYMKLQSRNQLLICKGLDRNGVPIYEDETKDYGLDFQDLAPRQLFLTMIMTEISTCFFLNHSVHQNETFRQNANLCWNLSPALRRQVFRNDGNRHFYRCNKTNRH